MVKCDFSGWATRNDLLCGDGRIIKKDAFKHNDGKTVSLVWNHQHDDPAAVLGKAVLENRNEGVYAYCTFNDTEAGKTAKSLVQHGDVCALSICANKLKHQGNNVVHGEIRELSLVLAGANPGAFIDAVMTHSDEGEETIDYLYAGYDENIIIHSYEEIGETEEETVEETSLEHSETEKEEQKVAEEKKTTGDEKTVAEVFDEMSEEQKTVVYAMIGMALEEAGAEEDIEHSEGDDFMKHNVFDQEEIKQGGVLTHADQMEILETAKETGVGSLQKAIEMFAASNDGLKHGLDFDAKFEGEKTVFEELLPDYKLLNPGAPEIYGRADQSWVMGVINKIKKTPYARIRTRKADARATELKAKGYNNREEEKRLSENIKLLGRKTEPTTIYLKEALHRDDITDITDFDVVSYVWAMMKDTMYETLALAALVGDGRDDIDPDKISETNIRPIWKDDELYTIHKDVDIEAARAELQGTNTAANFGENYIYAEAMITAALYAREKYKGTGTPDYYCAPHSVNVMLLARDLNGRRIYDSKADLAKALNVNSIIEIEQLEGKTRKDTAGNTKKLHGLFVNLADYQFGSVKGGEITKFSDFDIDFNKYKYLMETRLSGALTEPESAIALEELVEEVAG